MNGRVLLTGATGLIGRQTLAPLRARGFQVVALSRRGAVPGADLTLLADVLDASSRTAALEEAQASHLLHLAWHDAPQGRWSAPENLDWAAATLSLVRGFAAAGGTRALCVGSCAEYDWSYDVMTEDTPLKPSSLYGKAKAATGTLLTQAAPDLGIALAWARVFFCYGPGEPKGRLLGDLVQGLSAGQAVECTDGLQARDFLHTADLGAALAAVLDSELTGAVNVASGQAVPVKALIETTAGIVGRPDLIRLGARPRPADDPALIVADVTRLNGTGFRPAFDLRSGLADCVAAFRAAEQVS